jgi:hypothetical protein
MFAYGVNPDVAVDEATRDDRGPDTVNRILLHGARFHDRDAAFLGWEQRRKGWGWEGTPDWRADRETCRISLVLTQRLHLQPGDRVAMWLPLDQRWATIERAVWSIGAVSVPVWPEWDLNAIGSALHDAAPPVLFARNRDDVDRLRATGGMPPSVRAIVLADSPVDQYEDAISLATFLEYGGVLDTPERAAMWRTTARSIAPASPVSREYVATPEGTRRTTVDHADLMKVLVNIQRHVPPRTGRTQLLAAGQPDLVSRALLYAAWADGVSRTAFASIPFALDRITALRPRLVACRCSELAEAVTLLDPAGAGDAAGEDGRWLVVTDGDDAGSPVEPGTGTEGIEVLERRDFIEPAGAAAR